MRSIDLGTLETILSKATRRDGTRERRKGGRVVNPGLSHRYDKVAVTEHPHLLLDSANK
jgi:hypothetical protein